MLSDTLKKAREAAGFSIKKLSDQSGVSVKYLELLEAGKIEKLPAPVYTQGFLKKCALVLALDEKEILNDYDRESAVFYSGLRPLSALKYPRFFITPKMIGLVLFLVIALFVLGFLFFQFDNLIASPEIILDYPSEDMAISRSSIRISGRSDPSAKLNVNGQQIYVENDGTFAEEINLSPGLNTLKIEALNRFGKKSEIERRIIVE